MSVSEAPKGDILVRRRIGAGLGLANLAHSAGLASVIVLLVILLVATSDGFSSNFNLFSLTRNLSVGAMVGFGMMVVLACGHMNLALGAIAVCAVMATGWMLETLAFPIWIAVCLGAVVGAVLGALNGILIVRTKLHSFIVTLATASIFFGLMLILTKAEAFRDLPREFTSFSKLRYFGWLSGMLFVTGIAAIALMVLYRFTTLGKQMLAAGANPAAAELSGIPVGRVLTCAHALSGLLAAVAGIMLTARLGAALPSTGEDWLLPSFLAPLIGGTLLAGGVVSVSGAVLGALLVAILQNGLVLLNIPSFWVQFFLGLALLVTVGLDRWRTVYTESRRVG